VTVSDWLRSETPGHLTLLTRLRERLENSIETDVCVDETGAEKQTPSRDWCRAFARYQHSYLNLLVEERERAKLKLLAQRSGQGTLTDEEYAAEIKQLGEEVLAELSTADLAKEFLKRGMSLPVSSGDDDPD
jgi:hypothetical protein